jgi:hypothetical protein
MSVNHSGAAVTYLVTRKEKVSRVKAETYDDDFHVLEKRRKSSRHPDLEYNDMQPNEDGLIFSEYHVLEW